MAAMAKGEATRETERREVDWDQDDYGIDLSLIRENLRLTPAERARQGEAARRGALELLRARRVG